MLGFADTQKQMQELLLEARSFAVLQKKLLLTETRDKLSVVMSRLAIAVVCLLIGSMVLLFFAFFLAYIIGQALNNTALGFACVTAAFLLAGIVFWLLRHRWVEQPITTLMNETFTPEEQTLSTEDVASQVSESKTRMSQQFNRIMRTGEEPANNVERVSNWVNRGFAIYEGVRIGLTIARTLSTLFGGKRRRRR